MGAMYTILNSSLRMRLPTRWREISWSIVMSATLVLPAPVGAAISRFSLREKAASYTRDCTRFSRSMPPKVTYQDVKRIGNGNGAKRAGGSGGGGVVDKAWAKHSMGKAQHGKAQHRQSTAWQSMATRERNR